MCSLLVLIACATISLAYLLWTRTYGGSKQPQQHAPTPPPGPRPLPLIGSLHLLGKHATPFQAFTALSKIYGDVFSITLGASKCVVVNNYDLIKEVLITKGGMFGGRPDFIRFHKLFGGDRNNSLALCDWSALQKTRRSIARTYCSPRFTSLQYDLVSVVGCSEVRAMLGELQAQMTTAPTTLELKPLVLAACANMFTQYMCSTRFGYDDDHFKHVVRTFDEIFWEINQGYAVDFLPWLLPAYRGHMRKLSLWASDIRQFILTRIIDESRLKVDPSMLPRDFTDALLMHLIEDEERHKLRAKEEEERGRREMRLKEMNCTVIPPPPMVEEPDTSSSPIEEEPNMEKLNWQHIIFELEDFLGGHSAIGNLIMIVLASVVSRQDVIKKMQEEIQNVTGGERLATLADKEHMPYTEAVIWEALRTASSPIVPHVATSDTMIDGYHVEKGTVLFVNNYELNVGESYWDRPDEFIPERFLSETGHIVKPAHFIPFSTGKRTCIGQRLVQCFSFLIVAALFQQYDIEQAGPIVLHPSCVAVPPDTFALRLTPRATMVPLD